MSRPRLIIGLMSGTSVDAIDAALVRITRKSGRYQALVLAHVEHRWPAPLRTRLLDAMAPAATTTQEICQLNMLVAREFAAAAEDLLKASPFPRTDIAALASHGQTICHLPPLPNQKSKIENRKFEIPSTLQIGDISALATLTGIPAIGNFRSADMAVGGQGAPLVPWADDQLFSHATRTRCIQNIGGIANVTYVPPLKKEPAAWTFYTPHSVSTQILPARGHVMAFDTGPGNMLLDAVVRIITHGRAHFDRNGRMAARGRLCLRLLQRLQEHPYFARRPPKSTGREAFGETYARSILESHENRNVSPVDLVHTLTRLTAWSIADAYRRFLPRMPDDVILCGGGADNPVLVEMLAEELQAAGAESSLRRIDDLDIPNKAKEATSFALLGAATLDRIPANVPLATGARHLVILGQCANPHRAASR